MRSSSSRQARGSTLLVVLILVTVLMGLVAGVLTYANKERGRAVAGSRSGLRQSCAESGLQLARSYFGRNFKNWNTYLSNPSSYDPVRSAYNTAPANPRLPALRQAHPELFADLDGDGNDKPDVYIYIRDNDDEPAPLPPEGNRDNDHNVVVGAICISSTMQPRAGDTSTSEPMLANEGLLSYNGERANCLTALAGNGTGNCN
jgi:hypothetical protein